jgi:hypothetical protein
MREEQGRDQDREEMVGRRWWWGKGAAAADLMFGGRRFRRPVALEDGHDDAAVLLGAIARVRFDVGVVKCSAWPAGPACMRATRAAEASRGRGVRRRVAGRARDQFVDLRLGAAQGTWGQAELSRRCRSTAEPPRDRTPEEGHAARGDAAWAAPRSGARVRASAGQGASFNFV